MEEKQKIVVLDQNGMEKEAELLSSFKLPDTGKTYLLYTLNEKDENDMQRIYASILVDRDGMYSLETIENEDEWRMVKEIMKKMAQQG